MSGWLFGRRKRRDSDLEAEIAFDLAAEEEEQIASGLSPEEAKRVSRRDFGNVLSLKEEVRESWGWTWLERLGQDLRYGARTLRRNPLFTSMAVLSLALGIGANTALYSVMDAILFRALPVRNPGELVILNWRAIKVPPPGVQDILGNVDPKPGGSWESRAFPWAFYESLRDRNDIFSTLFAYADAGRLNLVVRGQAESGAVELVSGNFFRGLGIVPAAGRLLADSDNSGGAPQVAVISYSYWRERFGGDPGAIGQTVVINRIPFTIAGVTAPEFFGVAPGSAPVLYIPIVNWPTPGQKADEGGVPMLLRPQLYSASVMGRLLPGVTTARAETELAARFHQFALAAVNGRESPGLPSLWIAEGRSGIDSLRTKYSKPLFVLMTMVACILAIACANITNLLLARAAVRRREIGVRFSLGASRLRVLRQLLTESVLLGLTGGILGLGVAAAGIRFLVWLLAAGRNDFQLHAQLDWHVLAFAVTVAFVTGILFGFAPALAATRVDVAPALKQSPAGRSTGFGRRGWLSRVLVSAQIALSLLLVLGATLFVRSLANLNSVELGYNEENLLTFSLNARQAGYEGTALAAFYARMDERLRLVPGVRAVTETDTPLNGGAAMTRISVPGNGEDPEDAQTVTSFWMKGVRYLVVGPTFFETMQLPILLGRPIDARDVEGAPLTVVINEVLAKKYFPGRNPIGRHIVLSGSLNMTIVGLAKNARDALKDEVPPLAYVPYLQRIRTRPSFTVYFELRTAGNPSALKDAVRRAVHEIAPTVPMADMMTQSERIGRAMAQERTFADLCSAFAVLALVIACVGLYGSIAYAVSSRTNEIGIRMALGAQRSRIIGMVLREVLMLAVGGLGVGLLGAWKAMPPLKAFLFGVKPADPLAILSATAILLSALLIAGYVPARRASRIDPLAALRHE